MLAAMIHLMRGTPYIYQGEEIGMTNHHYQSITQYRDVESLNYYQILLNEGKTQSEALAIFDVRSRNNSRTLMQWDDSAYAGFSDCDSWIPLPDHMGEIQVQAQEQDPDSIHSFYQMLIHLRHTMPLIAEGTISFLAMENDDVLAYRRTLGEQELTVCCNLRAHDSQMQAEESWNTREGLLENYVDRPLVKDGKLNLRPYEVVAFLK